VSFCLRFEVSQSMYSSSQPGLLCHLVEKPVCEWTCQPQLVDLTCKRQQASADGE